MMPGVTRSHLADEVVDDLGRGVFRLAALRHLLDHLLGGCSTCAGRLQRAFFPQRRKAEEYAGPMARAAAWLRRRRRSAAAERGDAVRRVRRLDGLPEGRRTTLVLGSRRYHTVPVVDLLIERSRSRLSSDIREAIRWAELAVGAADRLPPRTYGEGLVHDVRARARVWLGKAQRRGSEFQAAERTLAEAESLLEKGTADPLELGSLLEEKGLLRGNQRRFDAAVAVLDRALRLYRRLGDRHLEGRTLAREAITLGQAGEPLEAIDLLERAARRIDPRREPRWVLALYHNLALYHVDAGNTREALAYLEDSEPFYRAMAKPADLCKLQWTQGRILLDEGALEEASERFAAVRDRFLEMDMPYEAATVSLELALAYAELGRVGDLKRLAVAMLPIFESRKVAREAMAALLCFREAAEAEAVTADLVHSVSRAMRRRGRHDRGR